MPSIKTIEIIATSEKSFDDAARNAAEEVCRTIHHIDSVKVMDFNLYVEDRTIKLYSITCKVAFYANGNNGPVVH